MGTPISSIIDGSSGTNDMGMNMNMQMPFNPMMDMGMGGMNNFGDMGMGGMKKPSASLDPREVPLPLPPQQQYNTNMPHLVNDINRSIKRLTEQNRRYSDEETETDEIPLPRQKKQIEKEIKKKEKKLKKLKVEKELEKESTPFDFTSNLRDFIIILGVYLLLSVSIVKRTFGKVIVQLNPEGGSVPFTGVAIYGLILSSLVILIKYLLQR